MLTKPQSTLTLGVTPLYNLVGLDAKEATTQICATIQACELADDSKRAPVDIEVALDFSGSMSGSKLELCKTTLALLLRQLTSQDRFGLVSFADEANIEIPLSRVTAEFLTVALQKIKSLHTRGCTNISAGMGLAAQELRQIESPNEVRSILLLTDGHGNVGICDMAGMTEVAQSCLSDTSITMHCFGYGSDHNEQLLRSIANGTKGGTYYFVENDSDVSTAFGDALGGILSVVAQNAVLHISLPTEAKQAGVEIIDVFHKNKNKCDDGSYKVTIGDFYAEERKDFIALVKLANKDLGGDPHVNVSISYMDTLDKILVTSASHGCAIARPPGSEKSMANRYVEVQWIRIFATQEMATAEQLSRSGNMAEARAIIQTANAVVQEDRSIQDDPLVKQIVADLDEVAQGLVSRATYATYGAQTLASKTQTHMMQRCAESTPQAANYYRSSKKAAMTFRFQEK